MPRLFDNAVNHGTLTGNVRATDTALIADTATIHAIDPNGAVLITGDSTISGITLEIYNGQAQFRDADVHSDDDYRIIRPTGDPHLWTAHRIIGGTWVVHAGCVRNIPLDGTWTADTTPDVTDNTLDTARQTTYDRLCEQHRQGA